MKTLFKVALISLVGGCVLVGQDTSILLNQRASLKWENIPKKVLAFYYGWYGNPEKSGRWYHWEEVDVEKKQIGSSTHYPLLGPYDSHDPAIVLQHCKWAKDAGIDAFIVSWWHPHDFHDQGIPLMLEKAQQVGLEITAYFETVPSRTKERALDYVMYLISRYGMHPAWLKVHGKPVVFIYGRAIDEIGLDGWLWVVGEANRRVKEGVVFIGDQISKQAAIIFDGIHTYNITTHTAGKSLEEIKEWATKRFPEMVKTADKARISCVTIIPGYDDSKLKDRKPPRPITERHHGMTFRILWEAAIAAQPDWILITSWNEWHEGSEIEPSIENADRELKTAGEYASRFKAKR